MTDFQALGHQGKKSNSFAVISLVSAVEISPPDWFTALSVMYVHIGLHTLKILIIYICDVKHVRVCARAYVCVQRV